MKFDCSQKHNLFLLFKLQLLLALIFKQIHSVSWFTPIKENRGKGNLSQYVLVALSGQKGHVKYTVVLKEAY